MGSAHKSGGALQQLLDVPLQERPAAKLFGHLLVALRRWHPTGQAQTWFGLQGYRARRNSRANQELQAWERTFNTFRLYLTLHPPTPLQFFHQSQPYSL